MNKIFAYGAIDLTKISPDLKMEDIAPTLREFVKESPKSGHLYMNCTFKSKIETSQWGHTHVLCSRKKGKESQDIVYGNFKEFVFDKDKNDGEKKNASMDSFDDLPF